MTFGRLENWCVERYKDDAKALRKARLLVRACLLTSIFSNSYVILSVVFSYDKGIYFTGFNVFGYFLLPFLLRTRMSLMLLGNIYTAIGAITVLVLTWFSGGMWSAIYPWIIAIPVLGLLVVGQKSAIYWCLFAFAWMVAFGVFEIQGIKLPVEYNSDLRTLWYVTILPGLLLIIIVVSLTFENTMQRALNDVELQKGTIEKLLEDKDHIIRILAHDLRNPLANITVLTRLLENQITDKESKEVVDMISSASANAQVLVKQVLEMATLDYNDTGIKLVPTNIETVVNQVVQSFRQTAENKAISISVERMDQYCIAMADLTYLRLVLENLVSNALKFSPSGKEIKLCVAAEDEQVQIRVRDFGPGVPVEEEDKLFKKFSRLSARPTAGESSNGLGLSLVKRYMELMDGKVWFERPGDQGSVFAIELKAAGK
jgi:signal transduction histidine kinase